MTEGSLRSAGRIAVVTAASGGIGGATARRLAEDGATVVAIDVDPEIERVARDIGGQAIGLCVDCTDDDAVADAFRKIVDRFGQIDILVNGVGGGAAFVEFVDSKASDWRRTIERTLVSAMLCARQVAPAMRERGAGKIVNVASSIALVPTPRMAEYAAAKAGVIGFTRSLALELAPFAVNVNVVSPGPIRTPATDRLAPEVLAKSVDAVPMGRIGEPVEIAHAIAFLASDEASFITGQNLAINGGRAFN